MSAVWDSMVKRYADFVARHVGFARRLGAEAMDRADPGNDKMHGLEENLAGASD